MKKIRKTTIIKQNKTNESLIKQFPKLFHLYIKKKIVKLIYYIWIVKEKERERERDPK